MPATNGLYLFSHDLRVQDNAALSEAAAACDRLLCVYCIDEAWLKPNRYGVRSLGSHRARFLAESLNDLGRALADLNQRLVVIHGDPAKLVAGLVKRFDIARVFRSEPVGVYEQWQWNALQRLAPQARYTVRNTHTLFTRDRLPSSLIELPDTFSSFRRKVEALAVADPVTAPSALPRPPLLPAELLTPSLVLEDALVGTATNRFHGGTTAGQRHVERYLERRLADSYKAVRNALDGWDNSSKWSAWLAHGCLSAREVLAALRDYESRYAATESSYWLYFELLWREYFQWYALANGRQLFSFRGIRGKRPMTTFYPARLTAWQQGTTPFPLVNACMNELRSTGYLSNRGRQIAASCLVNELALDWRYGAAWFEHLLVDYDVALNWGNWQYQAGVGADPRGPRHFNLAKQAEQFDPDGRYTGRWADFDVSPAAMIDYVDASDWPITDRSR